MISATAPSIGETIAQLIAGSTSSAGQPATDTSADSSPSTTSANDFGPAAFVTLSDQIKAAAVARAQSDQVAADRLEAFVASNRAGGTAADTGSGTGTQPTTGSKISAIVAQIKSDAGADAPPPFQTFTPTRSLSNSVTIDGFTLNLDTNASTQYYGIELSGNGVEAFNKHFGPSAGAGGASGVTPGITVSSGIANGNNEADDAITITRNVATADSASVSSAAGSASTSSVSAQSSSITFLVNYATGAISVQQSAMSVFAQASQVSAPGSMLSTLA